MDRPLRVLALSPIPVEGAGCRFRVAQFLPYLRAHGIDVTLEALFTPEFFRQVYRPGRFGLKAARFTRLALRHLARLRRLHEYDVLWIYRELLPLGPAVVERLVAARGRPPIVLDFDDAIFLPNVSEANRTIAGLKFPGKVATLCRISQHVIAGNDYLAAYARRHAARVTTVPTCVDTDQFAPAPGRGTASPPVVGWIGSPTTVPYIRALAPVLQRLAATHPFVLRISGAGEPVDVPGVRVESPAWSLDREVELFQTCDVGVYPLADDEWSKGKCGFKAIEFMACGVPVVASAVGVNREIIEDGVNGFLAATDEEFAAKLGRLIADPGLRARLAAAGRRTIEERYSLRVNAPRVAAVLREAAAAGRRDA